MMVFPVASVAPAAPVPPVASPPVRAALVSVIARPSQVASTALSMAKVATPRRSSLENIFFSDLKKKREREKETRRARKELM